MTEYKFQDAMQFVLSKANIHELIILNKAVAERIDKRHEELLKSLEHI